MSGEFQIRPATNEDAESIRALVFEALREFGFTPDPDTTDADLFDLEAYYFEGGGSFDVLITFGGEIAGTVGLFAVNPEVCELRKMYLAPTFRGAGYGKLLLRHAIDKARELGFRRIQLETASRLEVASRLYESFGFLPYCPEHTVPRCDLAYYIDL